MTKIKSSNVDLDTVRGFGQEWAAFDQSELDSVEREQGFEAYFGLFEFEQNAEGFDFGCGSGRWAAFVAPRTKLLHCIDASPEALAVARRNLVGHGNVRYYQSGPDEIPLQDCSQDFGYSLGVLHHIPDTEQAMLSCVAKLKEDAPFLVYLYYGLEGRPGWFRLLWRISDVARRLISRLPFPIRRRVTDVIAALVYVPLCRTALLLERCDFDVRSVPLSFYRDRSFYTMRTDALDRFGTRLEQRFSKCEIEAMMRRCGLQDIRFSDSPPYWVALGRKAAQ